MSVLKGCTPRAEVLKGDLDDAIFAADFGDLISGSAPSVYGDPAQFFRNTHPAKHLQTVVQQVFRRLADSHEPGAAIRLSTGFGGGKTHTLMVLWHLAQRIQDAGLGAEVLPAAGRPKKVTTVAIDAGKAGFPVFARHGDIPVKSLWGEVAFQLGGSSALDKLGSTDDAEAQPDEQTITSLFPAGPVLVLLDELVIYMAILSERGQGNVLSFIGKLVNIATKRPQTIVVITDPADQRSYAKESAALGKTFPAGKLDDLLSRKTSDFDPIGDESAKVIVRRLFEKVDFSAAQAASAAYLSLYQRVARESPGLIPSSVVNPTYAQRIVDSYPFHPRLLDTATDRLGALQEFNKSRGTLRLFARILRSLWESKREVQLISAGDLDWTSERIQADLLQRLNRDTFKAVVSADIAKHARELDAGNPAGIHARVASALLIESIPMQSNSGLDNAELTLAVLRTDEAGPEPVEAMERLAGVCWHTYPLASGRGWQFRYEPNVIKQIEERTTQIPIEDARSRVLAEVQGYFSGPAFKLAAWPASPKQVPETAELQLVLAESEKLAHEVCAYEDNSDPSAPMARGFVNSILAVYPSTSAFNGAIERAQKLLAAQAIEQDHKEGEQNRLIREQLKRLMPELKKQFRIQACRAFDRIALSGHSAYPIEERYQVPEDQMLSQAKGQTCIRNFLNDKGLIYQMGESLDLDLFTTRVVPGAVPVSGLTGVFTAKAIHERFLRAPDLRLLPDGGIVRETIKKAVTAGKVVVKLQDGRAYDASGCVQGAEGARRRVPSDLPAFPLDDSVHVALAGSPAALGWLEESAMGSADSGAGGTGTSGGAITPPPQLSRMTVETWEKIKELEPRRPLLKLHLVADNPAAAAPLSHHAQPLGADRVTVSITVNGVLKEGGRANFSVEEVKPSHPLKPHQVAQTLFNSMGEPREYEADLCLGFGEEGRAGMAGALDDLAGKLLEGVKVKAVFGKPFAGGSK